jgi:SAM-dependent methyltransferase
VLGLDPSPTAVATAHRAARSALEVDYLVGDAAWLAGEDGHPGRYDVAFAANVYHLLSPGGRRDFAAALAALVCPGGLLFLSTLSPRDAQHYAVGEPVRGEQRSWVENVYLHFCSAQELEADFAAFTVLDLEERRYEEHNAGGVVHHHTSWFLEGRRPCGPERSRCWHDLVDGAGEIDDVELAGPVLTERRDRARRSVGTC